MPYSASFDTAPQHGPRPLPLFLEMLRSETAASPERMRAALAGLRAYQDAPRKPRSAAMPDAARVGRACLRDYGGMGRPAVFIPSLINPPFIFDLAPHNSLLRWLSKQGIRPLLVDWGAPTPSERDLDIGGHVETLLLPLIDALGETPILVGYCLGGTMAVAAATLRKISGLALLATPWHFSGFPSDGRARMAALWDAAEPLAAELGYLPMEALQAAFWQLDPARTVAKYERYAALDPASAEAAAFVALEDWANAGEPLTIAAGRQALVDFFQDDVPGRQRWNIGGAPIDPASLTCPILDIVSLSDRIVPAATAVRASNSIQLQAGHVGMIIGRQAPKELWAPLHRWMTSIASSSQP